MDGDFKCNNLEITHIITTHFIKIKIMRVRQEM